MIQAVPPFGIARLKPWAGECLWVPTWSPQATISAFLSSRKQQVVSLNSTHNGCVWWGALVPILLLPQRLSRT